MKKARDKYRKGSPEALERTRQINRDRYNKLPPEKKKMLLERQKEKRQSTIEISRLQYRIDQKKKQIRLYEGAIELLNTPLFMLKSKLVWNDEDHNQYAELTAKIEKNQERISQKHKEIEELTKEKGELLNGK